jgi:hypothetical protein
MRSTSLLATAATTLSLVSATTSSKRGLCYVPSQKYPGDDSIWTSGSSDLTWYYNYQSTPSSAYTSDKNLEFVPMLWGASDSDTGTPFYDAVKSQLDSGANITYVLGFNEPDGTHATGGSALPVDLAAARWKAEIEPLKKLGIKVGAPAVTSAPSGWTWMENFFNECAGGCNPDFMPVHWYGNFEGMASHVGRVVSTYPNLTVWVTEYGFPNQKLQATQDFYNQSATMFDSWRSVFFFPHSLSLFSILTPTSNVTHYSYFGAFRSDVSNVGPNAAMLTQKGQLTDIGSWYLGGVATNNIPSSADARANKMAGWSLVVAAVTLWGYFA